MLDNSLVQVLLFTINETFAFEDANDILVINMTNRNLTEAFALNCFYEVTSHFLFWLNHKHFLNRDHYGLSLNSS